MFFSMLTKKSPILPLKGRGDRDDLLPTPEPMLCVIWGWAFAYS